MSNGVFLCAEIEGLPAGYAGRVYLAQGGAESVLIDELTAIVDPSSLSFSAEQETLWGFVWPVSTPHKVCGYFTYGVFHDHIEAETTDVLPPHNGKGIAPSVYLFVQRLSELRVLPSNALSPEGKNMWAKLKSRLEEDYVMRAVSSK